MVIGKVAQERLITKRALLVGIGGIGTLTAEYIVRAGINLRVIDKDKVELSNLQRQVLFNMDDVGKPKAKVAEEKLRRINPDVEVEGFEKSFSPENALGLFRGVDIVLDGTDNLRTRFVMNDAAVKKGVPYVYAACASTIGVVSFLRGRPCLNCFMPSKKEGLSASTAGVLGPTAGLVASIQVYLAIRYLASLKVEANRLYTCSLKNGVDVVKVEKNSSCDTCGT
ncbi:MAG: HesA/MoeB/ThiF family protein, partial [Candidatus Aenigmarchaeota archaeon]|nr:HesA/MoeB/ThiF family protein [Candidatus Aenigmarchaeota archaeon]